MWDSKKDKVIVGLLARNFLINITLKNKFTTFNYDYKKLYNEWKCKSEYKEKAFWYLTSIIDTYFYITYAIESAYELKSKITPKDRVEKENFHFCSLADFECKYHLDNSIINLYSAFELVACVLSIHLNHIDIVDSKKKISTFKNIVENVLKKSELEQDKNDLLSEILRFYNSEHLVSLRGYRKNELHGHRNSLAVYLPRMNEKDLFFEDIFEITRNGYDLLSKCYDIMLQILTNIDTNSF